MKFFTTIICLFFFEFVIGQIPGTPTFISKSPFPAVYTLGYTSPSVTSALVTAQVVNSGQLPIDLEEAGILWGTSVPSISSFQGKIIGGSLGSSFTLEVNSLPNLVPVYIVAYAKIRNGAIHYGRILTIPAFTVESPFTGRIWMAYNLGATTMPKTTQTRGDNTSYGNLYQWGRNSDGHEIILPLNNPTYNGDGSPSGGTAFSGNFTGPVNSSTYSSSSFITSADPFNWLSPAEENLWQGTLGSNNPCPNGYRIPTLTEFTNETSKFSSPGISGAFNSFLKLPVTGFRTASAGTLTTANYFTYDRGIYWTSTVNGNKASSINIITSGAISVGTTNRGQGNAVRCIQGESSSGGSAIVTNYSSGTSAGTMTATVPVSAVTQIISATVSRTGSYNIVAMASNGVTFRGSGNFAGTGTQNIELTASGTPVLGTPPGQFSSFTTNTSPFATFTRTVNGWTTNGTAVVSSYTPSSSRGILFQSLPISSNVAEIFVANVTTPGSYNITAINNGVTYRASGTFNNTGDQNFELTASGTPTNVGTFTFTSNTTPSTTFTRKINSRSSNGLAIIGTASGTLSGTITAGVEILEQSVAQKLTANVTASGDYDIKTDTVNGVSFRGIGNLTNGTNRPFNLFASGIPTYGGTYTYKSNTTPQISFNYNTLAEPSSNGSAIISSISLGNSTGELRFGRPLSNVTQELIVDVTKLGTYKITTFENTTKLNAAEGGNNGITYAGSGTFTNTGIQTIMLTATGTPIGYATSSNFKINTTPFVTFNRSVPFASSNGDASISYYQLSGSAGRMRIGIPVSGLTQNVTIDNPYKLVRNYNIQATNNGVTFSAQGVTNGCCFFNDITLTATGTPTSLGSYDFVLNTVPSVTWSITTSEPSTNGTAIIKNISLGAAIGILYPRVPASGVSQVINVNVERLGTYNITTNTNNGVTFSASGNFTTTGIQTIVLNASGTPTNAITSSMGFSIDILPSLSFERTAKEPSTNGTAIVSNYTSKTAGGTLNIEVPASGVFQVITANVPACCGSYDISTNTVNGVTFTGKSTFSKTGANDITLTASGTPIESGTFTYTLNTNPNVSFSRFTRAKDVSSNGSAIITGYYYNTGLSATLKKGVNASGITQVISAYVPNGGSGTYDIRTSTVNGVYFTAKGSVIGPQTNSITLTATGTPTELGNYDYTLNTNPTLTLNHSINSTTTNGTAGISYNSTGSSTGTLSRNVAVATGGSAPRTIVNVNVTTLGTYNLVAITNGLTFTASGTFTTLGNQDIVFIATGTPTVSGTIIYNTNTTPIITFSRTVN